MKTESWKADARLSEILRICLADGADVPRLMREWENQYDVSVIDAGLIRYIPYLFRRLHDLKIDARDYEILRGAYFKSWWVQMVFHKKNIEFLKSVGDKLPTFSFLKGIALQNSIYSLDPHTRPCEDVDIFVFPENLNAAINFLLDLGFSPDTPYPLNHVTKFKKSVSFVNDGISLDLNWGLHEYAKSNKYFSRIHFKSITIDNFNYYILDDTYNLIHTLLHATGWNPTPSTRWILDAALLIRNGEINWNEFEKTVIENGWQYPLSLQLKYLEELGISVPLSTKKVFSNIKPDFFGKAVYFYQRQPRRFARRMCRLLYSDYLAFITNNNIKNSFFNYLWIEPLVGYYFILAIVRRLKRILKPNLKFLMKTN